jgi:hypothetical protein
MRINIDERTCADSPEQFLATIKKEIELWREVAREAGVRPE